jgi:hypothetical protein
MLFYLLLKHKIIYCRSDKIMKNEGIKKYLLPDFPKTKIHDQHKIQMCYHLSCSLMRIVHSSHVRDHGQ